MTARKVTVEIGTKELSPTYDDPSWTVRVGAEDEARKRTSILRLSPDEARELLKALTVALTAEKEGDEA